MILAIPFHPALLTAADYDPPEDPALVPDGCQVEQDVHRHRWRILRRFLYLSDLVADTNYRLEQYARRAEKVGVHGLRLRVLHPVSDSFIGWLYEVPPLSQARPRNTLYYFLGQVVAFLSANRATLLRHHCAYDFSPADGFFPYRLTENVLAEWVKLVGTACSSTDQVEPNAYNEAIYAVWIARDGDCVPDTEEIVRRCEDEESTLSVNAYAPSEDWAWEFLIRRHLWGEVSPSTYLDRLPFLGGPMDTPDDKPHFYGGREWCDQEDEPVFGFYPAAGWQPGEYPQRGNSSRGPGYRDAWGAIWRSAPRGAPPPRDIHWDVQLDTRESQNGWRRLLELAYGRNVRWRDPSHPHINVEVNGRIVDDSCLRLT